VIGNILNLSSEYFQSPSYNRESVREIRALLGVQEDKLREYMFLFPTLYANLEVKGQNLFGNWQILAKVSHLSCETVS
jgi:hypothetical protein